MSLRVATINDTINQSINQSISLGAQNVGGKNLAWLLIYSFVQKWHKESQKCYNQDYFFISLWDIQWGSEIQTSLDFELSKRGWVANGQDFVWDLRSGSPTIQNPD